MCACVLCPVCLQVSVLDSVPDLDLLTYLPQLLDGLMNLLSDPNREIRVAAHKCMMEFLVEIQVCASRWEKGETNFGAESCVWWAGQGEGEGRVVGGGAGDQKRAQLCTAPQKLGLCIRSGHV